MTRYGNVLGPKRLGTEMCPGGLMSQEQNILGPKHPMTKRSQNRNDPGPKLSGTEMT